MSAAFSAGALDPQGVAQHLSPACRAALAAAGTAAGHLHQPAAAPAGGAGRAGGHRPAGGRPDRRPRAAGAAVLLAGRDGALPQPAAAPRRAAAGPGGAHHHHGGGGGLPRHRGTGRRPGADQMGQRCVPAWPQGLRHFDRERAERPGRLPGLGGGGHRVNVCPPAGGFPPELDGVAGAVFDTPLPDAKNRLAAAVLGHLWACYTGAPYAAEYRRRSLVVGRQIG